MFRGFPMPSPLTNNTLLELLDFPAALIDSQGVVSEVNTAWSSLNKLPVGTDFFAACKNKKTPYVNQSQEVAYAVEAVLQQHMDNMKLSVRPRETEIPMVLTIKGYHGPKGRYVALLHGDVSQSGEKLRQTIKDQALKAAEALARGFAAEMNNILGAVMGFTEMAREGMAENDPAGDDLDEVLRLLRRATSLTSSMQAFGRSESIPRQSVAFIPAVREALQRLLPSFPPHVRLNTGPMPDHSIEVLISQPQLLQIFRKIFQNTWESTDKNILLEVSITHHKPNITTQCHGPTEECVVLKICDDGPGMDSQTCEKIFEPLFTTKPMSTGMGLTLIHGIISSLGGTIEVSSAPGSGTCVEILLPVLDDNTAQMHKAMYENGKSTRSSQCASRQRASY